MPQQCCLKEEMADEQILDGDNPEQAATAPEDLQGRVAQLEEQLAAAQDQALRMAAEVGRGYKSAIEKTKPWQ